MAILGKITVQILVNGQALQEYADHELIEENSNVAEKHVEATTGAPFAIKLSVADPSQIDSDALSFIIHLDGKLIQSTLLRKAKFSEQFMLWEQIVHGVTTNGPSTAKMKPFLFSEITCSEETRAQSITQAPSTPSDIGIITVKIHRKRVIGLSRIQQHKHSCPTTDGVAQMAEKKLKGTSVTHNYRLGKEQSTEKLDMYDTEYMDGKDDPTAVFLFKYCSRKGLQNMLLVPRTPTPTPWEERSLEELNVEELQELAKRQQERFKLKIERTAEIKPEDIKADRGIKRERDPEYDKIFASAQAKKVKVPVAFAFGEMVDFSDD